MLAWREMLRTKRSICFYFSDVDECSQGSHDCLPSLASCTNTAGSYSCACNAGYVGDGKTSCELTGKEKLMLNCNKIAIA